MRPESLRKLPRFTGSIDVRVQHPNNKKKKEKKSSVSTLQKDNKTLIVFLLSDDPQAQAAWMIDGACVLSSVSAYMQHTRGNDVAHFMERLTERTAASLWLMSYATSGYIWSLYIYMYIHETPICINYPDDRRRAASYKFRGVYMLQVDCKHVGLFFSLLIWGWVVVIIAVGRVRANGKWLRLSIFCCLLLNLYTPATSYIYCASISTVESNFVANNKRKLRVESSFEVCVIIRMNFSSRIIMILNDFREFSCINAQA